jgi:cullin-4
MKSSPRSRKSRTEIFAPGSNPKVGDSTRSKRARLGKSPQHSADTLQTRNQDLTHVMLSNFPSSPKHSNFVDLTSSPSPGRLPASPYFPRSNGAKTASQQNEISERFKVKNLRAKSSVDPDSHFHLLWGQLDDSLELVFAGRASNTLDEEDYRRAQAICQQGDAPRVSDRLRRKCGAYVKGPLKKSLLDQCHNSNVDVLRNTVEAWATWQAQVVRFCSL